MGESELQQGKHLGRISGPESSKPDNSQLSSIRQRHSVASFTIYERVPDFVGSVLPKEKVYETNIVDLCVSAIVG